MDFRKAQRQFEMHLHLRECPGILQFNASHARIPLRRNQFLKIHHVFLSLKFLMKFSEIHSLNFHLEDSGGAKWKLNFFPTL